MGDESWPRRPDSDPPPKPSRQILSEHVLAAEPAVGASLFRPLHAQSCARAAPATGRHAKWARRSHASVDTPSTGMRETGSCPR